MKALSGIEPWYRRLQDRDSSRYYEEARSTISRMITRRILETYNKTAPPPNRNKIQNTESRVYETTKAQGLLLTRYLTSWDCSNYNS